MNHPFALSRRTFIQAAGATGLCVVFNRLSVNAAQSAVAQDARAQPAWGDTPGKARFRIDGVAKVTGQKIYARDFRARDMPGWPAQEQLAMVLRATVVDRLFEGLDLSMLPAQSQPTRVVTQVDLEQDHVILPYASTPPQAWPSGLLVAAGQRPIFFGQPLALLLFRDFESWRQAKRLLQFNPQVVRYGAQATIPVVTQGYDPTTQLTRVAEAGFSQVQSGRSNPFAHPPNKVDLEARQLRDKIDASFKRPGIRSFEGRYSTQVLDPLFMEPEAGLAWRNGSSLQLVLGTQATNGDLSTTLGLFADPACPIKIDTVVLNSCYPGGGFGGRDTSTFPPLLALAAAYADGPVRIAQDRYEQFQSGLKQLDSTMRQRIAVTEDGYFVAFQSQQDLRSGGNNNYSQFVAELAAYCGVGGYNIGQAAVDARAVPTSGVIAGSMRGFGGPQASFAVESLVDEVAAGLMIDPIRLRERNVLRQGDRTVTGAPLEQPMQLAEICRLARQHPLWQQRHQHKPAAGLLYGVGFALANQAYGTGTDGVMAEVSIAQDGQLTVRSNCVDMGNGSATTLAISTAKYAGANAKLADMGEAAYFVAPLGFTNTQTAPDWNDPRWTASFAMSSSACLTAFHQVHVAEQASRVLFETGLLPAAAQLWGVSPDAVRGHTQWRDNHLTAPGLPALDRLQLARQLYALGLPAAAMAHAVYQGQWVVADYQVGPWRASLPLDGLSTRLANRTDWRRHDRANTGAPPADASLYGRSLFAPSGALAAVQVERSTGKVKVLQIESFLDAGRVLQPDLLQGQSQGGVVMGIGYALLENIPLLGEGGGNGRWNLDNYHVALASDVPLHKLGLTILPSQESTAKGIAEAVLCPIAPAIANAVAHATGKRFRELPITPEKVRKALHA
nr:molybdopterin cofactor-binding domain-containing protein [uncultured Albidiferax sp.]